MNPHDMLLRKVEEEFILNNFLVEKEVKLPFGKGALDILAYDDISKFYIEIKSSPQSINSKKVQRQFNKYRNYFGDENIYFLISPSAKGEPRICSLDGTINCLLENFFF